MTTAELITIAREMGFRQCGSLEVKRFFITHNVVSPADRDTLLEAYNEGARLDEDESEYDEWQASFPLMGGDDGEVENDHYFEMRNELRGWE